MVRQDVLKVQVYEVRYQSENGAVFVGEIIDNEGYLVGERINVALPGSIADKSFSIHKGQVFEVSGKIESYDNKKLRKKEKQIKVKKLLESKASGDSFVDYIGYNPKYKNIGVKLAGKIWSLYGVEVFKILDEEDVDSLIKVEGLGSPSAIGMIVAWKEDKKTDLLAWLGVHGLPKWLSRKVLAAYPEKAIEKLNSDPYRLLAFSQSWKKVDAVARDHFGIAENDDRRLHAAVTQALYDVFSDGDTAATKDALETLVTKYIDSKYKARALRNVYSNGGFVQLNDDLFQSRGIYLQEKKVARDIASRCNGDYTQLSLHKHEEDIAIDQSVTEYECKHGHKLTEEQVDAIRGAVTKPISIITGGAGVGKTTVLECVHSSVKKTGGKIIQMALAGRAAKRMTQLTGEPAMTIAGFVTKITREQLKTVSHILIDEASMLDLPSASQIFRKLSPFHKVVMVGDNGQLMPVGPGLIFHTLASGDYIQTYKLTKIWRADETTGIPMVSRSIREGRWVSIPKYSGKDRGVFMLPSNTRSIGGSIMDMYEELGGPNEEEDVRIICPTKQDTDWGTLGINKKLNERWASSGEPIIVTNELGAKVNTCFRVGDLVMETKNNWEKDIMNGSLGRILRTANQEEIREAADEELPMPVMEVEFDHATVLLDAGDIKTLEWGYAVTCHKSQGSQFRRVIIPIVDGKMLDVTMIYTALTRGVDQVVFVGDEKVIKKATEAPPKYSTRCTAFEYHLKREFA